MADDQLIVACRRLAIDLRDFKSVLHKSYPNPSQQATSAALKNKASMLAETWLADLSQRPEISGCVSAKYLADLTVHFQRLLTFAERATTRRRYDEEVSAVLKEYTTNLVVPLMQGIGKLQLAGFTPSEGKTAVLKQADAEGFRPTAFVGHSFASIDKTIVSAVTRALEAIGVTVVTGEKPRAERISDKVKGLIDAQHIFVGIFTRRDRLVGKKEWSTSAWVIDEKAYASRTKKLILLKEAAVESIGGIQGDYEFIEFQRDKFEEAIVSLLQLFSMKVNGFR